METIALLSTEPTASAKIKSFERKWLILFILVDILLSSLLSPYLDQNICTCGIQMTSG